MHHVTKVPNYVHEANVAGLHPKPVARAPRVDNTPSVQHVANVCRAAQTDEEVNLACDLFGACMRHWSRDEQLQFNQLMK